MKQMVDKILELALKQVGIKDDPVGSCNNKFNAAYYGGAVNNRLLAWCVVFIWWLFKECGMSGQFYGGKKTASVSAVYTFYKQKGLLVNKPKPGDLVFYDFTKNGTPDHIGIVYDVKDNGSVVAIEGNTSSSSQTNGGTVQKKTRTKAQIFALARPEYEPNTGSNSPKKPAKTEKNGFIEDVQKALGVKVTGKADARTMEATVTISPYRNRTHPVVKILQKHLKEKGYEVGTVDGIAGPKFTRAVRAYQKDNGCVPDGIITAGQKTWKTLLS